MSAQKGRSNLNRTIAYLREEFGVRACFPAKGLQQSKTHGDSAIHQADAVAFTDRGVWLVESTDDGHTSRARKYFDELIGAFAGVAPKPKCVVVTWKKGRLQPRIWLAYLALPGDSMEWVALQMR